MKNDEYTDKQQALFQILGTLEENARKKSDGENTTQQQGEPDSGNQEQSLGDQARQLADKATEEFKNGQYADAQKHISDVLAIIDKLPDNNDHKEAKAHMLNILGNAEYRQGLYDMSVKHLQEAIAICEQLPDTIKYQYAKETFEDNLEEVKYKIKKANEPDKDADDSLLDSLQNKSSKDKKYISQKDIEANYHFTNEKPKSFDDEKPKGSDDVTMKLVLLVVMIVFIFVLLKFC